MNSGLVPSQRARAAKTQGRQDGVQETGREAGFLLLRWKRPLMAYAWPRRQVTIVIRVTSDPQQSLPPSGLALLRSTADEGPGTCQKGPLWSSVPIGQGHTCLKPESWSMASLALKDRGNATFKILQNSRVAMSGRDRPSVSPS